MKKMKSIRILAVLLTAVFAVGVTGTAVSAAAAESEATAVTATFTNGPVQEEEPAGSGTNTGSSKGSGTNTGSSKGSGVVAAQTSDRGGTVYLFLAIIAAAGLVILAAVVLRGRHRAAPESIHHGKRGTTFLSLLLVGVLTTGLFTTSARAEGLGGADSVPEGSEENIEGVIAGNEEDEDSGTSSLSEEMTGETEPLALDEEAGDPDTDGSDVDLFDENEDEDAGIRLLALEGEETLTVTQKVREGVPEDTEFSYHLYFITSAKDVIGSMSDITGSSPVEGVTYDIFHADGTEAGSGTTDEYGSFTLRAGQSAQFAITLGDYYGYYVTQDTHAAYPLVDVTASGESASVVESENVVVYDGMEAPVVYYGTVTLTLYDSGRTPLEGGVFSLYRIVEGGQDELIEENLTTDAAGQITVDHLSAGDYYFEETDAPTGYYLPDDHYSKYFTIHDHLTAAEYVTREMHDPALQDYNVKYAVSIYGIQQDSYSLDGGSSIESAKAGLTFGPATGASYISTYQSHMTELEYAESDDQYCIHWMSWEEIIEQCAEDPTVFEDCLENGCTHSVKLILNSTLLKTDYSSAMQDGDGAGYLNSSIGSNYRLWNSDDYNDGGWPASQVRAVLNGEDDLTGSYATYALDASKCLFSCFPSALQEGIVAKAVKSDTAYDSQEEENNTTTYDKLWLFSGKELYGDSGSNNDVIRTYEGELYQRSETLNITTSNYGSLKNYSETGGNSYWWLRSPYRSNSNSVCYVNGSGDWSSTYANGTSCSLAPGFCLK